MKASQPTSTATTNITGPADITWIAGPRIIEFVLRTHEDEEVHFTRDVDPDTPFTVVLPLPIPAKR